MREKIVNAKTLPEIYYGLHMVEGTAEYRDPGKDPYRIYIGEEALKKMDPTFSGKPVYVDHVDEINLDNLQEEMDGVVVESFFNKCDGKHWVKFVVMSDKGKEAIRMGWKLSNAYIPKSFVGGGLCHGVEYAKEVTMAEYEHLAIVKNPRYEESIILTPEQFKSYNIDKEAELLKVANSKGEESMFFKREKVANSKELEATSVTLPLSKVEKTIAEVVEIADKFLNMAGYANGDHMVKVGEDEMSVNDMIKKFNKMKSDMDEKEAKENKKKNADDKEGDLQKKAASETELETGKKKDSKKNAEEEEAEKKKNAEKEAEEKKKNEEKEAEDKKKNEEEEKEKKKNALYFDALKNAPNTPIVDVPKFELSEDRVARGKSKYGSN